MFVALAKTVFPLLMGFIINEIHNSFPRSRPSLPLFLQVCLKNAETIVIPHPRAVYIPYQVPHRTWTRPNGHHLQVLSLSFSKGEEIVSEAFYNDVSIAMVNQTFLHSFLAAEICSDRLRYIFKREKFNFRQERHGMKHVKLYDLE